MSTIISKTKTNKQTNKQTNNRYSSLKYNNGKRELECKAMNISSIQGIFKQINEMNYIWEKS